MIPSDILAKIYKLELKTRRLLSGPLAGDYRSKLKGSGFEFNQLREYQQGDDIRFIDWKSSARANKMLVRQYLEDRNRTVILVVDVSASTLYGSGKTLKSELIMQLAGMLAFVALHNKDSVGLILFTDKVELYVSAGASREHVINILKTLISYKPKEKTTDIDAALKYIASLKIKNSLICFISDFTSSFETRLFKVLNKHHDIIAFRCSDAREIEFLRLGMLIFKDNETNEQININTSRNNITNILSKWRLTQKSLLNSVGIDCFDAVTDCQFTHKLVQFLRQRIA